MSSEELKRRVLAARLPKGSVEIPDVGTVVVRGMSRDELRQAGELDMPALDQEAWTLARCLVDPAMTEDEVKVWQRNSPAGELNAVTSLVNKLSGIGAGADKEQYKSV